MFSKVENILLFIVVMTMCGCSQGQQKTFKIDNLIVSLSIDHSKEQESNGVRWTSVYGRIEIGSNSKIKLDSINLNCFQLAFGNETTDDIFIDSYVHYFRDAIKPNSAGKIVRSVYWTFSPKAKIEDKNLALFKLNFDTSKAEKCVSYNND